MKQIEFDGEVHQFPDDFTDADIAKALGGGKHDVSPTLLASRQEASKQEFENNRELANTPAAGLASIGQGVVDAGKDIVQAPINMAKLMASPKDLLSVGGVDMLSGMIHGVTDPVVNYVKALRAGDANAAAYAGGQGLVNTVPAAYGVAKGAQALYRKAVPPLTPSPQATAADAVVQKLAPKTAEAKAQAGVVANDALARNSVPEVNSQGLRDARIYQNLENAKAELKAAKASVIPQPINGQPLLAAFDSAIDDYSVKTPPHLKWGMETRTAIGDPYQPLQGVVDPETLFNQRGKALANVRDRVAKLMNDRGQIASDKLQDMKEIIDKEIQDHGGWKESTSAADRANLAALREGNGYLRDTLRNLGNDRLNKANDAFSHNSTLSSIVDSRRPDIAALDSAEKADRTIAAAARERRAAQVNAAKTAGKAAIGGLIFGEAAKHAPSILGSTGH